ncbi:putative dehydrogenase [Microbacterium terrae]|uniref:1,5-anhydro-D-fructose reductase n=1 Tax=Microbacterium terrae TaxID=69369 RepID=A0A0M2H213_9MICO|nr:Gfo/Idh/MocA family oxidoreductase [Microbacterium terrae]KJL37603.1 1,5-anhydro-D-fructose reductase [Microbacterium terrae]MBP1076435.1 putative dehydrogenase [Microbacterium terrae]GLJ97264.1 dehydrogenase [Microbacterium terrae]
MRDVVIVGAGGMGRAWAGAIQSRDDARVVGVVDIVDGAAERMIADRGLSAVAHRSIDSALAAPVDLVVNATIPEAHYDVSAAALRAGVPVLSEKPVVPTVEEALRLAALSDLTGTPLSTSQSRSFSAGMSAFAAAVDEVGGTQQLSAQFFEGPRFGGFRDEMPHPLLVDMAIHTLDAARLLIGSRPESVYCEEFNPDWSWYEGDASAIAVFSFAGGARFTYDGSWCADGARTSWNGLWRAGGPHGAVSWDGETVVERHVRDEDARPLALPEGELEALDATLEQFLREVDGGPASWGGVRTNVWTLAMVEGAVLSAGSGRRVSMAEVFRAAHAAALRAADPDVREVLESWPDPWPPAR